LQISALSSFILFRQSFIKSICFIALHKKADSILQTNRLSFFY
jgi:hypothetical protein